MPELPDITVYRDALERTVGGQTLTGIDFESLFLLRTVDPKPDAVIGKQVTQIERIGKRIVLCFDDDLFLVFHLMIAGRLRWRSAGKRSPGKVLAAFHFDHGTLWLTEASSKKRASLHVVRGRQGLREFDRGGLDILSATPDSFRAALQRENRTLKRALTDPRILDGIGNAYSDEILFAAKLSPVRLTSRLDAEEIERLRAACVQVLGDWTHRLSEAVGEGFPEKVTAFHPNMNVHGRYREPCRECERPIQRIKYAANECNYCAQCQNAGRLLADRALSTLMKKDWPKTLEELEEKRSRGGS